jgi:hypothetical protein
MTKVFVLPIIGRKDYDAFRRDLGSKLAGTYDEWAKLLSNEADAARRLGKTVVEVDIDYDEFTRYCVASGKKPGPLVLLQFAIHKPLGEA